MIKQAVILCAGKGTRLGEITSYRPKPLVEAGERPFLCWLLDDLISVGITDIVLLVGYLRAQFEFLGDLYPEVRLVDSNVVVNKGVLGIKGLDYKFLLANGDCYPIFREEGDISKLLETTRRPSLCLKVQDNGTVKDCGLATIDKTAVEMGLINCGNFSSMQNVLADFFLQGNLHINDLEGLKGAETWLSGKTSTVTFQQASLVSS